MPPGLNVQNDNGDGIVGTATGPGDSGVVGSGNLGVSGAGNTSGVWAWGGIYGVHAYGSTAGVYGSGGGMGVVGDAGGGAGLYGTGTTGVFGQGRTTGLYGDGSGEQGGTGVYGAGGSGGTGVYGSGGTGVIGVTTAANGIGLLAVGRVQIWGPLAINDQPLFGGAAPPGPVVDIWGDLHVSGSITGTGAKSAVVKLRDGSHRALYCVESPECWFEDFGRARLVRGKARVHLERTFAAVIRTGDYHVFLSPEGLSHGLYVSRRTRDGFEVREQQHGRSTVEFSYRIVARRKDVQAPRFKRVRIPARPKPALLKQALPQPPVPPKRPPLPKLLARQDLTKMMEGASRAGVSRRLGTGKKRPR